MMAIVACASAQIKKGTFLLGGSSAFDGVSYDKDAGDDVQFDLWTKGAFFIVNNLALGLNVGVDKPVGTSDKTIVIGPFFRYYIKGKVFAGAGITSQKFGNVSGSDLPIELGYAAFLNDIVAIEPALKFDKFGGDFKGSTVGMNIGMTVYFGR